MLEMSSDGLEHRTERGPEENGGHEHQREAKAAHVAQQATGKSEL